MLGAVAKLLVLEILCLNINFANEIFINLIHQGVTMKII